MRACRECHKWIRKNSKNYDAGICYACYCITNLGEVSGTRGLFSVIYDPLGRLSPYRILRPNELKDLIKRDRLPEGSILERKDGKFFEFRNLELVKTDNIPVRLPLEYGEV
jgi:hypothetical protein